MIIHSDYLENGIDDEYFKYVSKEEFVNLIEDLKQNNYKILSWAEEWYYLEINNED